MSDAREVVLFGKQDALIWPKGAANVYLLTARYEKGVYGGCLLLVTVALNWEYAKLFTYYRVSRPKVKVAAKVDAQYV